jgi:hypothetical protein
MKRWSLAAGDTLASWADGYLTAIQDIQGLSRLFDTIRCYHLGTK